MVNDYLWRQVMCKWSVSLLVALYDGPMSFSALAKGLGVSNKVLVEKLRRLVRYGLVSEVQIGGKVYALTERGRELSYLLKPLVAEGVPPAAIRTVLHCKWMPDILKALWLRELFSNELYGKFDGLSWKVFSEMLKKLEEFQMIRRSVIPSRPVRVKYRLESKGRLIVTWMLRNGINLGERIGGQHEASKPQLQL